MGQTPEDVTHEVTGLLLAWRAGEANALDRLMGVVYPELKRLARRHMRGERDGHTLQTTALVNEAFLRLVDSNRVQWNDRAHFFALSAQLMRRILTDSALDTGESLHQECCERGAIKTRRSL